MRWAVAAAALGAAAACGDTTFNTVQLLPVAVTVSQTSNNQTGAVGQPLANPVSVQVTDNAGTGIANVVVTWTVLSGGGSVSSATSTTDVNGNATVIWTLGTTAGQQQLEASIATGASTTITATGVSAAGSAVTIVSGNNQNIALGASSAPLVVMVTDQFGNPVAGAPVAWSTSGGTLSATQNVTDASGHAAATLTTAGVVPPSLPAVFTVTATSGTLAPAAFTITAQ
jgi:adhesin/invasin